MIEASASRYEHSKFNGNVSLIMASGNPPHVNFLPWWQAILPQAPHTQFIDGHHLGLTEAPAVHEVAAAINSRLARVEEERLQLAAAKSCLGAAVATAPAQREADEDDEEERTTGWRIGVNSMHTQIAASPSCN